MLSQKQTQDGAQPKTPKIKNTKSYYEMVIEAYKTNVKIRKHGATKQTLQNVMKGLDDFPGTSGAHLNINTRKALVKALDNDIIKVIKKNGDEILKGDLGEGKFNGSNKYKLTDKAKYDFVKAERQAVRQALKAENSEKTPAPAKKGRPSKSGKDKDAKTPKSTKKVAKIAKNKKLVAKTGTKKPQSAAAKKRLGVKSAKSMKVAKSPRKIAKKAKARVGNAEKAKKVKAKE